MELDHLDRRRLGLKGSGALNQCVVQARQQNAWEGMVHGVRPKHKPQGDVVRYASNGDETPPQVQAILDAHAAVRPLERDAAKAATKYGRAREAMRLVLLEGHADDSREYRLAYTAMRIAAIEADLADSKVTKARAEYRALVDAAKG